jgi:glycosyltransferase involved in cell wall biosynthesis
MISVCLASYNGGRFIRCQIESILMQLGSNDELIISDDSSTDNTIEIIETINDSRILLLKNNTFRNPIQNFQNALVHAKGDYIFLSDQDDLWMENKVKLICECFNSYDLVVSDCKIVDNQLNIIHESYFKKINAKSGFLRNLVKTSPYIGCCMAFKRSVLQKALPFPNNISMHDYWVAMVAELFFKVTLLAEPLVLYRRHGMNVSNTGYKSSTTLIWKIKKRWYLLKNLRALLRKTHY